VAGGVVLVDFICAGLPPEFFFVPDEMVRLGPELGQRYADAWEGFAPLVQRVMRIERITDPDRFLAVYRQLLDGQIDPAVGYVVGL